MEECLLEAWKFGARDEVEFENTWKRSFGGKLIETKS
jgi:hypothetical protein